jgi:hypothetical protein
VGSVRFDQRAGEDHGAEHQRDRGNQLLVVIPGGGRIEADGCEKPPRRLLAAPRHWTAAAGCGEIVAAIYAEVARAP